MSYYNEPYYNEVDPSNHGPNTPRYNRAVTVYNKQLTCEKKFANFATS